jgi:hypothetical protein
MLPIAEIRQAADILQIIQEYTALKKSGNRWIGRCPFHQEKTPSFSVRPEQGFYICFGCGVKGDIFKFLMLIENIRFPEAATRLAERFGVNLPAAVPAPAVDPKAAMRQRVYADQIDKESVWWKMRVRDAMQTRMDAIAGIGAAAERKLATHQDSDILWGLMVVCERRAALWRRIIDRFIAMGSAEIVDVYSRRRDRSEFLEDRAWTERVTAGWFR